MAQLIESKQGSFKSFLDVGTGTGILSLVAYHYGAEEICAVDYDEFSMKAARVNFQLNKSQGIILRQADIANFRPGKHFDFVAANLITFDLIKLKAHLIRLVDKGGHLAVSGISLDNAAYFRRNFASSKVQLKKIREGRKWAAFLYQKLS